MKFILNSKKVLFAVFAAVLFSACLMPLAAEAELTPYRVTVTYYPNGGAGASIIDVVNQGVSYTVRKAVFSRANYTFSGWNTNAAGTGYHYTPGQTFALTGNLNLYAKWTKSPTTTVTYYANGGTGATIVESVSNINYTIRQNSFIRTGYIFSGWNTNAAGTGYEWRPGTTIILGGSLNLYAKWTAAPYKITYYPNGGTGSNIIDATNYGTKHTIRQNIFTRAGHTFDGWYTNTAGTGTKYTPGQAFTVTGNLNFYAKWTAAPYKITYNPNGGRW